MSYVRSLQCECFLFAQQSLLLLDVICTIYYEIKLCITNELSSILGVFVLQKKNVCVYTFNTFVFPKTHKH